MTYPITTKTIDIIAATAELGYFSNSIICGDKLYLSRRIGYFFDRFTVEDTDKYICSKSEYDDFITGLSHYAGKNYYERYLTSTRTPLEPKIKDGRFEHGEELRLEHAKDLVVYMADCTAYEGFCIVLIDNTPERVNNLYLSRPETAEQKAAKERGIAITEMVSIVAENMFTGSLSQSNKNCTDLYDAGYRK